MLRAMNLPRLLRLALLAASALLAACESTPWSVAAPSAERPRLIVFLVVDGLPQRQVTAYRDQLAPDGFARFLDRGAWFDDAHYGYAYTVTAAGHATMLTGAYPHRTGIIGNEWRDVNTGAAVYNTGDPGAKYIGGPTQPLDGTSPRNLKVETVGDVLRRLEPRSKVIGISGKDRGAILPAGHAGTAYMYQQRTGLFSSSTYYMPQHPAWVDAFNAAKPADKYFKTEWKPLLPDAAYARSLPDDQPWFGPRGGRLPMTMGVAADAAPGPAFYGALLASPFVDRMSLEFARAAIAGEALGRDDAPDILSISLSGHDYVNHAWSAESRMSHDHFLQLDRLLEAFFRDLDAAVGRDNYIAMLTADHGFAPTPEYSVTQGRPAGRLQGAALVQRVQHALQARYNQPDLLAFTSASALVLNRKRIAEAKLDPEQVAQVARDAALQEPGIEAAYTRGELLSGSRAGQRFFEQMRKSWHPDVSGDVQYVLSPYWIPAGAVATHGSPHPYDTNVPMLLWGPRWVAPGQRAGRVEVADIAPTMAAWLKIPAPVAAEGKPLPLGR